MLLGKTRKVKGKPEKEIEAQKYVISRMLREGKYSLIPQESLEV